VEPPHPTDFEVAAVGRRTKTGVVEGHLFEWFDLRVWADPAGAVELVNIRAGFVEIDAASLACAVGKDHYILRHCTPSPKVRQKANLYHRLCVSKCELAHLRTARGLSCPPYFESSKLQLAAVA